MSMWLGIAGMVGAVARGIGESAADLEPEQRRDGIGFGLMGVAIVVGAAVWWQVSGVVGEFIRSAATSTVGLLAWALPLVLGLAA